MDIKEDVELKWFRDIEFIEKSELLCGICHSVMTNPVLTVCLLSLSNCQHRFCNECLQTWRKNKSTCPICRLTINQIIPDIKSKRQIQELEVVCRRKNLGCSAAGVVGHKETGFFSTHEKVCEWKLVRCVCSRQIFRKDIKSHLLEHEDHQVCPCAFSSFGCHAQEMKMNIPSHLINSANDHLFQVLAKFQEVTYIWFLILNLILTE
jgi:hypothetical protein